jgi:small subunit ribosomal protein S16
MYRIVVADSRAPRDGAFVESIGYYHPLDNPSTIVLDAERAKMWLDRGAQPSERVAKILATQSIMELPKKLQQRIELIKSRPAPVKEEPAAAAPAPAAPAPAAPAPEAPAAETPAAEEPAAEAPATEEPAAEAGSEEEAAE